MPRRVPSGRGTRRQAGAGDFPGRVAFSQCAVEDPARGPGKSICIPGGRKPLLRIHILQSMRNEDVTPEPRPLARPCRGICEEGERGRPCRAPPGRRLRDLDYTADVGL